MEAKNAGRVSQVLLILFLVLALGSDRLHGVAAARSLSVLNCDVPCRVCTGWCLLDTDCSQQCKQFDNRVGGHCAGSFFHRKCVCLRC